MTKAECCKSGSGFTDRDVSSEEMFFVTALKYSIGCESCFGKL